MTKRKQTANPNREVVFFTAEDSARFRLFAIRCGSRRAAREALGCNELMLGNAIERGRVMPATRERLLAKLDRLERGEVAA